MTIQQPGLRVFFQTCIAVVALIVTAWPATAQPVPTKATYSIFETSTTHRLERRSVETGDGARYEVFRAIPRKEPPPDGYPVLTLLDGNAVFDRLTPDLLVAAPDLVLIGIGYDTPLRFASDRRSLDYTPPCRRTDRFLIRGARSARREAPIDSCSG